MKKYDGPSPEETLVQNMIELMEKGETPWRRPWTAKSCRHTNMLTDHRYSGTNLILLEMGMHLRGGTQPFWVGADQARKHNVFPKKGSKSVRIIRPQLNKREEEKEDGEKEVKAWTSFKIVPVFNVCDLQGDKLPELIASFEERNGWSQPEPDENSRIAAAEAVLGDWEVPVNLGSDKAYYEPVADRITLPALGAFHSPEGYYATWAHECVHSTGHPSRLRRDLTGGFGSRSYAIEELVAELGALLLCNQLQIGSDQQNHAAYLQSWVTVLKEEPKILLKSLSAARKGVELILGSSKFQPEAAKEVAAA